MVAHENRLRVRLPGINANKITKIYIIQGVPDIGDNVGSHGVSRAIQNFGRAQLVGHIQIQPNQFATALQLCVDGHGISVSIVTGPHLEGEGHFLEVADAIDALRLALGGGERRQQHGGQNGDDGDHDEQLDQCEGFFLFENVFHIVQSFVVVVVVCSGDDGRILLRAHPLSTPILKILSNANANPLAGPFSWKFPKKWIKTREFSTCRGCLRENFTHRA
jgi:hypothetical protein